MDRRVAPPPGLIFVMTALFGPAARPRHAGLAARLWPLVVFILLAATALAGCIAPEPGGPPPMDHPGDSASQFPVMPWPEGGPTTFPELPERLDIQIPGDWTGGDPQGNWLPPGLWSEAAARHPLEARLTSPSLLVAGAFHVVDAGSIRLSPGTGTWPGGSEPITLLFEDAQIAGGEPGTLIVDLVQTATITGTTSGAGFNASSLIARQGEVRAGVGVRFGLWLEAGNWSAPAPYNETLLHRLDLELPSVFTLSASGIRFIDASGNETLISGTLQGVTAKAIHAAGSMGFHSGVERILTAPIKLTPTNETHIQALSARGTITVGGSAHTLPEVPMYLSLQGTRPFNLDRDGASHRILDLAGNATDLSVGGNPRLGSAVAAVPNHFEIQGTPGDIVEIQVILAEGSGGATAHLAGHRVEGVTPVEVQFKKSEPFQFTPALEELFEELADFTQEHPISTPVTVPFMLGIGILLPFAVLFDGLLGLLDALSAPYLGGAIPPDEAQLATFKVEIPETSTDATLFIQGSNFPDQPITLQLRPETEPDAA